MPKTAHHVIRAVAGGWSVVESWGVARLEALREAGAGDRLGSQRE